MADAVPTGTTTILYLPEVNTPSLSAGDAPAVVSVPPAAPPKAQRRRAKLNADLLSGKTLGVYRCDAKLGRGAMGVVYLAMHQQLERRCALKVLSPKHVEADADYVSRFRQEAVAVANLHHPHVVMAYAVGEHEGLHFLEMEFVSGKSLQKVLDARQRLEPADALRVTAQIADGLAAAHRAGLVHRDVKPENVLMTKEPLGLGRAKIGDFGLAKRVRGRGEKVFDALVGTPHYMAPELFAGAAASPTTDVYALGVCLYRMLTGRLPYATKTVRQLITQVRSQPFPDVRADCP
ncbi:MAG TPA: serine/threonine-protein kinase, partial [Planctomycetaceae bacterium]|nr:serine/threonine-protein kinase [Planctomycetaceae bacterium]